MVFDEDEVAREIERITNAAQPGCIGEALFLQVPFFACPSRFHDPDVLGWLDDYGLCKQLHKGRSGASLDDESAFFLDAVRIISSEHLAIQRYLERKAKRKVAANG